MHTHLFDFMFTIALLLFAISAASQGLYRLDLTNSSLFFLATSISKSAYGFLKSAGLCPSDRWLFFEEVAFAIIDFRPDKFKL